MVVLLEKHRRQLCRQENEIFNILAAKIKKSKKMIIPFGSGGDKEIYILDDITIHFDLRNNALKVKKNNSNSDSNILDIHCAYISGFTDENRLRRARYDMFMGLLKIARQTYEKTLEKEQQFSMATEILRKLFPNTLGRSYVSPGSSVTESRLAEAAKAIKQLRSL